MDSKIIDLDKLIHISSSEGSFANYHDFYYLGYYLTIEEYLSHDIINIIYSETKDGNRFVDINSISLYDTDCKYLKKFIEKFDIRGGYDNIHPKLIFLEIDRKIKRQEKIKKLL